ncbi:MAG: DNA gyrase inhibitor YacG [Bacteriovoracaceae bacterium]
MKKKIIKCPHCKKEFNYYESKFRPFCSERCKMVDLGHWFSEEYTIPVSSAEIDSQESDDDEL